VENPFEDSLTRSERAPSVPKLHDVLDENYLDSLSNQSDHASNIKKRRQRGSNHRNLSMHQFDDFNLKVQGDLSETAQKSDNEAKNMFKTDEDMQLDHPDKQPINLVEDHFKNPINAEGEDDELNDRDGWNKVEV
jgi:hypothetical protein